jgi:hypothetical protein
MPAVLFLLLQLLLPAAGLLLIVKYGPGPCGIVAVWQQPALHAASGCMRSYQDDSKVCCPKSLQLCWTLHPSLLFRCAQDGV